MPGKMIMSQKKLLFFVLIGCLVTSPAYAYLDGGTGSVLVQSFIAGIAGFLALVKLYWQQVKGFYRKIFSKKHAPAATDRTDDQEIKNHHE